jgi:hypothetical protein
MTMTIHEGDLLIVSGSTKEYPIRRSNAWETTRMNTLGFRRMATKTATIKRGPGVADGLSDGDATTAYSNLRCTPLDPASLEIQKSFGLDAPIKLLETFVADNDGFIHLVVEDIQNPTL